MTYLWLPVLLAAFFKHIPPWCPKHSPWQMETSPAHMEYMDPAPKRPWEIKCLQNWQNYNWLVVGPPLWKIWTSIGMISNPIYGKIKNVPNHQPDKVRPYSTNHKFSLQFLFYYSMLFHHFVDGISQSSLPILDSLPPPQFSKKGNWIPSWWVEIPIENAKDSRFKHSWHQCHW